MSDQQEAPQPKRPRSKPLVMPSRARWGDKNFFNRPESRATQSEAGKVGGAKSSRLGIRHGQNRAMVLAAREAAEARAELIVERLIAMGKVSEEYKDGAARTALEAAVAVIEAKNDKGVPIEETKNRIAASRLVLEYTMEKPAQKNEHVLKNAEEFLAGVLEDEEPKK